MAYTDVSEMAADPDLRQRIYACAASRSMDNAAMWVDRWAWVIVATDPAWVTAWAAAEWAESVTIGQDGSETRSPVRRGWDSLVISDAMILERVRSVLDMKGPV